MKTLAKTPLAITLGTTLLSGFAASATQTEPPTAGLFAVSELAHGYMQLAEADTGKEASGAKKSEGSCGEAKCGAQMKKEETKAREGSCGTKKMEPAE